MTACASQHIRAARADNAIDELHGQKGFDTAIKPKALDSRRLCDVELVPTCGGRVANPFDCARANSSSVTPRCRVQYLTWSWHSITILLRSGVIRVLLIFCGTWFSARKQVCLGLVPLDGQGGAIDHSGWASTVAKWRISAAPLPKWKRPSGARPMPKCLRMPNA